MGLRLKPHTVLVYLKGEALTAPGLELKGQLTPASATMVMTQFGVDLKRPHMWLGDAEKKASFQEGGRLKFGGRTFSIAAKQSYDNIGAADHVQVILEELPPV